MDPTITKASTGNERIVAACAESQSTSRGPNRTRNNERVHDQHQANLRKIDA
jgi:hypothetical protein